MKSIKHKLIVYFTLVMLFLAAVLGIIGISISQKIVKQEAEKGLISLAQEAAKLTESRIKTQLSVLETISEMQNITSMNWKLQRPILLNHIDKTDFLTMAVVHLDDGVAHYIDGTTADLSDRDYIQEAFSGNSSVSDIIISRVTNEAVLMLATPIMNGGKVDGVLIGRCSASILSDIINDIAYGQTGYAYMINSNGTVTAHKDNDMVMNQWNPITESENDKELKSVANAFNQMITNKSGVGTYTFAGLDLYNAYAEIQGTNWIIAVTAEKGEVLSSLPVLMKSILYATLGMVLAGLIIIYFIGNSFAKPIAVITSILERFANYDLSIEEGHEGFKYLERKDETGQALRAMDKMHKSFTGLIKQAITSSELVGATSQELSASIQEISSNAQNQASTTEEISSSMEEMTANISVVSDNMHAAAKDASLINQNMGEIEMVIIDNTKNLEDINQSIGTILTALNETRDSINTISIKSRSAAKEADGTVSLAMEGKENLDRTVNQMTDIQSTILNLAAVINGLGESASQIGDITNLIKDVAEQTNLLALNASIEAARAGEHGKGFAVVAQAIGNLAEESQNAAKEIEKVIKSIQAEIGKAVVNSEEGTKVVESGTHLVKETSGSLERIFEAIRQTSDIINEITSEMEIQTKDIYKVHKSVNEINTQVNNLMAAMEEETASAAEIKNSIDSITQLINDISESMEQQSAASEQVSSAVNDNAAGIEEISAGGEEIATSAEELARSAQELIEQVARFKV